MKKFLSLCLAMLLALSCVSAFAEDSDLQAQLDEANARIEDLQAQVDRYYPYYISSIVAEFADGTVIPVDDVQAQYDEMDAAYQQYGYSLAAFGMEESAKLDIVNTAVEDILVSRKAAELGVDTLDETEDAELHAEAQAELDSYIDYYCDYFFSSTEDDTADDTADEAAEDTAEETTVYTDEQKAEAAAYWEEQGITEDSFYQDLKDEAIAQKVYNAVTADVAVTEEDIKAAYDQAVADDESSYTDNDYNYNNYRNNGTTIYWNPEGYRAVKQVLVKFDDDQSSRLSDLNTQLDSLNTELETVQKIASGEQEADEETEYRVEADIQADIDACNAEIDALYAELLPRAQEVVDAFNNGTDIETLIGLYNEDPGMTAEPAATQGYAVSADSTYYDSAFVNAAMSIANIGEISEPARGSYGYYIVYYLSDITPGAVAYEDVKDAAAETAKQELVEQAYEDAVAEWAEEAGVQYYWESFGVTSDSADTEAEAEADAAA